MLKNEFECYNYFKTYYVQKGYMVIRTSVGSVGLPDFILCKGNKYYWIEIKFYKGKKKLQELKLKDLKFQPGQIKFKNDLDRICPNHYRLVIFNTKGDQKIYG